MTSDNAIFRDKIFTIQYKLISKYFFLVVKNKEIIIIAVLNSFTCITTSSEISI